MWMDAVPGQSHPLFLVALRKIRPVFFYGREVVKEEDKNTKLHLLGIGII